MKYIVYKITNQLNQMIYIGCHKVNNNLLTYYGSGTNIRNAIKQFGKHNFIKEVLFEYDNSKDMLAKEAELVNTDFISRSDTYNIILGGGTFVTDDCVNVKDKNGNYMTVHKNNPRWLSGELVGVTKGLFTVKDKDNNTFKVSMQDSRFINGEVVGIVKNKIAVKDKDGNKYQVDKDDPRYLNGELVSIWKDKKHTKESIEKMRKSKENYGIGEANSMFGKTHSEESKQQTSDALARTFYVYDLDGNFISKEKNVKKYALLHNLDCASIGKVLNGKYKTSGKKRFYYEYQGLKIEL